MEIFERVKSVLESERDSINELINWINPNIEGVVRRISECDGKVILTGIGKPGHISKKISATLSSLGIPSFFLHPSESLHGDLGVVTQNDILLAYSFSGSSSEIIDTVSAAKKKGCWIIGFTSNNNSRLASICNEIITYPPIEESCIFNLAPTNSTTITLALGDAVAIAASELKGFNKLHFAENHPAGKLGRQLNLKTSEIMIKLEDLPIVNKDDSLIEVLKEFGEKSIGFVIVVNVVNHEIEIITDGDIRRSVVKFDGKLKKLRASDISQINPKCVNKDEQLIDTLKFLNANMISFAPVVDDQNKLIGAITMKDIVNSGIL